MTISNGNPAMARTVHLVVAGDHPSPELLVGWERLGVRPLEVAAPEPGTSAPCLLLAPALRGFVRAGLTQPFHGFVEQGRGSETLSTNSVSTILKGGLALSLTTSAAYSLDAARLTAAAIGERFGVASHLQGRLELVLAEAAANAVIHGNLGLSSEDRGSVDGVAAFQSAINERLADPNLATRRIEIAVLRQGTTLTLGVTDHGQGYDLSRELSRPTARTDTFGRGLALIRWLSKSVTAADGGRTLLVAFDLG